MRAVDRNFSFLSLDINPVHSSLKSLTVRAHFTNGPSCNDRKMISYTRNCTFRCRSWPRLCRRCLRSLDWTGQVCISSITLLLANTVNKTVRLFSRSMSLGIPPLSHDTKYCSLKKIKKRHQSQPYSPLWVSERGEKRRLLKTHSTTLTLWKWEGKDVDPSTPRLKPWVIQSFLTFDSMYRTLQCNHSLESCWAVLYCVAVC